MGAASALTPAAEAISFKGRTQPVSRRAGGPPSRETGCVRPLKLIASAAGVKAEAAPMLQCPTDNTLTRLLTGKLSGPERSSVEAHLATCATCRERRGRL